MVLTDPQMQLVGEILARRGADRPCPACGHSRFDILKRVLKLPTVGTPLSVYCVGVSCQNCGLTMTFGLQALGLGALLPREAQP